MAWRRAQQVMAGAVSRRYHAGLWEAQMTDTDAKRARFRALHRQGLFCDSQSLGRGQRAAAAASGICGPGLDQLGPCLDKRAARLCRVAGRRAEPSDASFAPRVDLPINADFESGFAVEPEAVAANVTLAIGPAWQDFPSKTASPAARVSTTCRLPWNAFAPHAARSTGRAKT